MAESFSRCQNEMPTLPAFEDRLEGNAAAHCGGRAGEARSSTPESVTNNM